GLNVYGRMSRSDAVTTRIGEDAMSPTRRTFLRTCLCCAPAAAAAIGGAAPPSAQAAKTRIDVHHHFIPPFHLDSMMMPGRRTGGAPPKWSPQLSLEDMDKSGIATAVLSVVQPGVWYGNNVEEARTLARKLNDYGATMAKDHP